MSEHVWFAGQSHSREAVDMRRQVNTIHMAPIDETSLNTRTRCDIANTNKKALMHKAWATKSQDWAHQGRARVRAPENICKMHKYTQKKYARNTYRAQLEQKDLKQPREHTFYIVSLGDDRADGHMVLGVERLAAGGGRGLYFEFASMKMSNTATMKANVDAKTQK